MQCILFLFWFGPLPNYANVCTHTHTRPHVRHNSQFLCKLFFVLPQKLLKKIVFNNLLFNCSKKIVMIVTGYIIIMMCLTVHGTVSNVYFFVLTALLWNYSYCITTFYIIKNSLINTLAWVIWKNFLVFELPHEMTFYLIAIVVDFYFRQNVHSLTS